MIVLVALLLVLAGLLAFVMIRRVEVRYEPDPATDVLVPRAVERTN